MAMLLFLLSLMYSMWWVSVRMSWSTPTIWLILFLANSSLQFASQMVHSEKHITLAISLVIKLIWSRHQTSWPCIDFARLSSGSSECTYFHFCLQRQFRESSSLVVQSSPLNRHSHLKHWCKIVTLWSMNLSLLFRYIILDYGGR